MYAAVEIYTEKPLWIKEDSFLQTALRARGIILPGSVGYDRYRLQGVITSGKRVAALGRDCNHELTSLPAGLGPLEAYPGRFLDLSTGEQDLTLELATDLILDPGILADVLGIRLVNRQGKCFDIPLCRPDVAIWWEGRGKYAIPLTGLLHGALALSLH